MDKGFTLIEVLAYVAIAAIVFGGIIAFSEVVGNARVAGEVASHVEGDGNLIMDSVMQSLRDAIIIAAPRASTTGSELILGSRIPSIGPFVYIASSDISSELQVVNVASSSNPYLLSMFNLNSGADGPDALSVAINDALLYVGRTANAASPEFYILNISNPSSPSLVNTLEIGANLVSLASATTSSEVFGATSDSAADFQTISVADVGALSVLSAIDIANLPQDIVFGRELNRVFVASSNDTAELQVISGGAVEASFDLTTGNSGAGGANGLSVTYKYPYIFLGRAASAGREFYVFDVSTPASPSLVGQIDLSGDPNDMYALGDYVFIASTDDSSELQIIDISTPSLPVLAASFNLTAANSGNDAANAISITGSGGNFIYLGRSNSTGAELSVLDISNLLLPSLVGDVDLDGNPNGLGFGGGLKFNVVNGIFRLTENTTVSNLNAAGLRVDDISFANLSGSGTAGSARLQFTLRHINTESNSAYGYQGRFIGTGTLRPQ